jgi:hypothetical protein
MNPEFWRGQIGRGRRAFARSVALVGASVVIASGGCTARTMGEPVPPPLPSGAPRPPGMAIDPVLELPHAAASAEPVAGLAVLYEPVDPEPARRVVRAFFEAVVVESMPELEDVMERGAHTRANTKMRAEPALPWWQRRFERLDYTALGAEVFYRRSNMEARTARDAAAPGRPLPANPRGDDVVVRVPISGQAADKLFGSELVFLVKKSKEPNPGTDPAPTGGPASRSRPAEPAGHPSPLAFGGYKIAELFEDFRLP